MMKTASIVLAGLLLTACHAQRDTAPAQAAAPVFGVELKTPRPGLFTAGQPAASDWRAIKAHGIGTVINLRTEKELAGRDEAAEVQATGMRYVSIPVAGADGITDANARLLLDALNAANGPVLVHCASGNRVGGLLAVMEAKFEGLTEEQALDFGRKAGMTSLEPKVKQVLEVGK